MNFHWQNLNDLPGRRKGSGIRHGRCWLGPFEFEWSILHRPALRFNVGLAHYDCALSFGIGLIFCSFWLVYRNSNLERLISDRTRRKGEKYGNGREITVYWFEGGLWWAIWQDPIESRSRDPWYVRMHHWNVKDILFGSAKYESLPLRTERVVVPMPEGGYPATVQINEDTWKRPRWPFARRMVRSELTPDTPIPHPGKGENSWDCGEDALYGQYGPHDTGLKAAVAACESVMRSRLNYGGGWNYKQKTPAPQEKEGTYR